MSEFVITFTQKEWYRVLLTPEGKTRSDFHDFLVQPIIDWLKTMDIEYEWYRPFYFEILTNGLGNLFFYPHEGYDLPYDLPDGTELVSNIFDVFTIPNEGDALYFKMRWNEKLYQGKKFMLEMFMYPEIAIVWATEKCGGDDSVSIKFLSDWAKRSPTMTEDWPDFIEFLEKSFSKNVD